jgi:hypothetical protein
VATVLGGDVYLRLHTESSRSVADAIDAAKRISIERKYMKQVVGAGLRCRPSVAGRRLVGLLALLTVSAAAACESHPCTLIGRTSTIIIDVQQVLRDESGHVRATACVESTCRSVTRPAELLDVVDVDEPALNDVGPVLVSLSIERPSGALILADEVDVSLIRRQPNGPDCPPIF